MPSRAILALAVSAAALTLSSCGDEGQHTAEVMTGGNVDRGAAAIERYGCGSCHIIPGISGAQGLTGAPLSGVANRIYIAGILQNTPENMMRWIENAPAVDPKTVMPNLGVTHKDAMDIAGYLYTLK
ncbi:MAG: cytochrome C [Bryobacteraceae bacterium]